MSFCINVSLERRDVILYGFMATKFLKGGHCPYPACYTAYAIHGKCGTGAPYDRDSFLFPCENASFVSPFKHKTWFLTRPYVPLGSYYATVFLVGMIVYGQMYVCMFLCMYIFGWVADGGWLDGWRQHSVIVFLQ